MKVAKKPKRVSKLKAVIDAATELTPAEKRKLIGRVEADLLRSETPVQLRDWQIEELEKSVAEYEADPSTAKPWEKIRAELRKEYDF